MKTTFGQFNRFRRWSIFEVVLIFLVAGSVTGALAQALPGGTLNPLTIPKYVTPLVIPPVMKDATCNDSTNDYDIAVRQFKQQILPGGIWNTINGRTDAFPPTTVWSYGPDADPLPDSTSLGGGVGIAPAPNSQFNYPAYTIETVANLPTILTRHHSGLDKRPGRRPYALRQVRRLLQIRRAILSPTSLPIDRPCTGPTRSCYFVRMATANGLPAAASTVLYCKAVPRTRANHNPRSRRPCRPGKRRLPRSVVAAPCKQYSGRLCYSGQAGQSVRHHNQP